jgi:hypothetical protein
MSVTNNSDFEGSFARAEVDMVSNILEGKNHRGSTIRDSEGNEVPLSPTREVNVSDLEDLEPDNEDTVESQPEVIEEVNESEGSSVLNDLPPS